MSASLHLPSAPLVPGGSLRAFRLATIAILAISASVLLPTPSSGAATAPGLGTATSFAVLAGSTVTNTGPSVLDGDLGVSPGNALTGFATSVPPGPGIVSGSVHADDLVAADAQDDALAGYGALAGQPCDVDLTGQDLGGLTLTPGVYCFSSSAQLTGALTLDGVGDPGSVFVFQIGSTLTTASASTVLLTGSSTTCNVFWQVGSSATLGTASDFVGTAVANTSITATTGVDVAGRLLALGAAVTLDTNDITAPVCETPTGGGTSGGTTTGGSATGGPSTDDSAAGGTSTGTAGSDGGTDATPEGGGDGTDGGASGGASTGGAAGGATTDGATTSGTTSRPDLPATGSGSGLIIAGGLAIAIGMSLTALSRARS